MTTTMERPVGARRPGRPRSLTTGDITRAVLTVGFDRLTVQAVAAELGVNHATLYRYVSGREELVQLGVDQVAAGTEWPEPGPDWRPYLQACAWTLWDLLCAWPGLPSVASAAVVGSEPLEHEVAAICGHLLHLGFAPESAALAVDLLFDLATDARRDAEQLAALAAAAPTTPVCPAPRDPRQPGALRAAVTADPREWFARKLAVALDGIQAGLAPRAAA